MKVVISLLTVVAVVSGMFLMVSFNKKNEQVRHVVVFKYKEGASEEQIRKITDAFRDLKDKIPGIVAFETGVNNSPENLNRGFTHIYLLTFKNAEARDAYLPHPEHKAFGKLLRDSGIFEEVFVVDYNIEK